MNSIPQEQLAQKQLDRLAAQRQLYSDAKRLQAFQMILSIPVVVILSLIVVLFPDFKVYLAFWGITVTLLDVSVFNPWQKSLKQKAARIQELFDCDVLQMDWRELKVGGRHNAETIAEAASKHKCKDPDFQKLKNWYPVIVAKLPLHLARIVCQRASCWWDAELRRRYAMVMMSIVGSLTLFVFLLGIIGGITLENFFLVVLAPLLPVFTFGIRQFNEHRESANTLDRLKGHSEKLWDKAVSDKFTPEELAIASRELQDEIYDHRKRSPLVFDWIYRRLRGPHEEQMNKGAEELVEEALQSEEEGNHERT